MPTFSSSFVDDALDDAGDDVADQQDDQEADQLGDEREERVETCWTELPMSTAANSMVGSLETGTPMSHGAPRLVGVAAEPHRAVSKGPPGCAGRGGRRLIQSVAIARSA